MPTITNPTTGEVKVVTADQLGNYGLTPQDYTNFQKQGQATLQQNATGGVDTSGTSNVDATAPTDAYSSDSSTTTPEQIKFQSAWKTAGTLADQVKISTSFKDAYGYDLFSAPKPTTAQANQQKMDQAYSTSKDTIQNLLDMYQGLPGFEKGRYNPTRAISSIPGVYGGTQAAEYNNQKKALSVSLKDIAGAGLGSGVRVTQTEINMWSNLMPGTDKTDAQNKMDLASLDRQLKSKFGKGLDPEYLKAFGLTGDPKKDNAIALSSTPGATPAQSVSGVPGITPAENTQRAKQFGQNAINDVGNLVGGLAALPGAIANQTMYPTTGTTAQKQAALQGPSLGKSIIQGTVDEYGQLLQDPLGHAYQHPVNTLLDLIPFFQAGKAAMAGKAAGETGTAAKAASVASTAENASLAGKSVQDVSLGAKTAATLPKTPPTVPGALSTGATKAGNILKGGTEAVSELVGGGGTKDFLTGNTNLDMAVSMSKSLMKYDVLSSPTEAGRIIKTTQALTDVGSGMQKVFENSPQTVNSLQLSNTIGAYLRAQYPDSLAGTVDEVTGGIMKEGKVSATSVGKEMTMSDVWGLRKAADQFGAKAFGITGSGPIMKQMARDVAGYLRGFLGSEVPEATPYLRDYRALSIYKDDILQNPKGLEIGGLDSVIKGLSKSSRNIVQFLSQKGYNIGNALSPDQFPSVAKSSGLPSTPPALPQEAGASALPAKPPFSPKDTNVGYTRSTGYNAPMLVKSPTTGKLVKWNTLSKAEQAKYTASVTNP